MNQESGDCILRNLLFLSVLLVAIVFTAYQEGYLGMLGWPFSLVLLWGLVMAGWLAKSASTGRMLSLVFVIFSVEYVKEALGTRYGFWIYHGTNHSFVFGVWAWVLGGLSCFSFATKVVIPILRKWLPPIARGWNSILVLSIAVLGLVLFGKRVQVVGWLYGVFYLLLILISVWRAPHFDMSHCLGFIVGAWAVSLLGEYVGATINGLWTFPGHPKFPPLFLLFACWPIEIMAQTAVAMGLVPLSPSETKTFGIEKGER